MRQTLRYMTWPFIITGLGLVLAALIGWRYDGGAGAVSFFLIAGVLAVLEISLSFDNAIVNANKLKQMTPKWQRRFLTWGIIIAVFGMRIVFPLLIVVVAANIGPWQAMVLAATQPDEYSRIMQDAHLPIAAFGGTFLMMVGLSFFFDSHVDFFEEIAKFRAARRIWARWMRDRFGATSAKAQWLRFHTQTAGVSLTAQQPDNNVTRTAIEALAAVLGGTNSLHTNALDEVLALPTEQHRVLRLGLACPAHMVRTVVELAIAGVDGQRLAESVEHETVLVRETVRGRALRTGAEAEHDVVRRIAERLPVPLTVSEADILDGLVAGLLR